MYSVGKMQSFSVLKQVVYIVTILFQTIMWDITFNTHTKQTSLTLSIFLKQVIGQVFQNSPFMSQT
jgi:hypothetical protein